MHQARYEEIATLRESDNHIEEIINKMRSICPHLPNPLLEDV